MSAKVKVISKTSKSAKNIISKLDEFLKNGDYSKSDINFLKTNFDMLKKQIDRYLGCLRIISESNYFRTYKPEIHNVAKLYYKEISNKSLTLNDKYNNDYYMNYFSKYGTEPTDEIYNEIIDFYVKSRDHVMVNYILHTCDILNSHPIKNFNGEFDINNDNIPQQSKISKLPTIPFYDFNIFDLSEFAKKENCPNLANALHSKLSEISNKVYKIINTPNIDIDKFISIVFEALQELEKQVPRCKKAFELIKNSMSLFKENFFSYNMEYNITQNPITIIESFVKDVKEKNKVMNPKTIREFLEIIKHFTSSQSSIECCDPSLIKAMNAGTQMLSTETNKLEKIIECEKTGEDIPTDIKQSANNAPDIMEIFNKLTDEL